MSRTINVADRLRQLIDLIAAAEPGTSASAIAGRAHFSRDHLDRLLRAATGETPATLARRLLLERAAWELAAGGRPSDVAAAAGYGSAAAFSRAFRRAYGVPPGRHDGSFVIDAPNGIHFHPPAGLSVPSPGGRDGGPVIRMLAHHLDRTRELIEAVELLGEDERARPLRPGLVVVWFEGEEPSAEMMAERLVGTIEVWAAAIAGESTPGFEGPLGPRLERAARGLRRSVAEIDRGGGWEAGFVDALCEPPQTFSHGAVIAHILGYGAVRREALASVLRELGADVGHGDPILWDLEVRRDPGAG